MLSTQYRLRLEFICKCIANGEDVKLEDMIWAEKLSKANTTAREWLRKARRQAANPDMQEGSMDDFMNRMGLGDPDPSNHRTGFESADEIVDWFQRDKTRRLETARLVAHTPAGAAVSRCYNKGMKNTHLEHLEDDILNSGTAGGFNVVSFCVRSMTC